jgi:1-phosphofructokinase family hexose kinase
MILTVTLNPAVDLTVFGGSFRVHETNRGRSLPPDPGGKGNNVARVARLLGADVTATGLVGGFTGDFIEGALAAESITPSFFRIDGITRFTAAYLEQGTGLETKIVPDGPEVSREEAAAFVRHDEELIAKGAFSVVALSGSLPRGVGADFYSPLIEAAGRHGVPVVLDTSGPPLREAVGSAPLMVKPNLAEATELFGADDKDELFRYLRGLARTIPIVALTMGREGALFFTRDKAIRASAGSVAAVNPVGAGDAFVGGFSAAYDKFGDDRGRLFRWAVAAGTACAGSSGLLFAREAFDAAEKSVVLEELA